MTSLSEAPNQLDVPASLQRWLAALGVSLGTAILIVSPFFWLGNASGHDIAFHASSWLDVTGQWKQGIVYPRWCEWANHGFGEPRFIFYPPLSWMLGAALGLVAPWNAVPGIFVVLAQTLAGLSMFALARRFFPAGAAIFAAACYAGNPYALLVIYMRSDFAEELACAVLPALLVAALQLCGLTENRWRSMSRATATFGLLFAAVWLANAPAGVMASYSLALLFVWAAIAEKSRDPLWRGAAGLALGLALAAFYLLPAAYEQRWVNIGQALSSGLQPSQNFLYTKIEDSEHNQFNWIASSVAVLLIVMTGIAAFLAQRHAKNAEDGEGRKRLWLAMLALSAGATILMLRPSSVFWELLPKLRFVQFPWRWMAVLAVPYAYFGASAFLEQRPYRAGASVRWMWLMVVILAVAGTATFLVRKAWWDSEDIPSLQEAIANGHGFDGTDEYDPVNDDHYDLPANAPQVQILPAKGFTASAPKTEIRIMRWTAEERDVTVASSQPLRLALRLLDYPAWRVEVNAHPVTPQSPGTTAQMILPLAAGTERIKATLVRTPDRAMAGLVSSMGGLSFLILMRSKRKPG